MFDPMGRGEGSDRQLGPIQGRRSTMLFIDDDEVRDCVMTTGSRIRPTLGVSIEEWGRLEEPDAGFARGTPFVLISADCADEKLAAKRALEDIARITDLAWDYGWTSARVRGRLSLLLRVFPEPAA